MTSHYIGIMSGTSVDAVDGVILSFDADAVKIEASCSRPIPDHVRREAIDLIRSDRNSLNRAFKLANQLTGLYAGVVDSLRKQQPRLDIAAIGCHGQTIRHFPHDPDTPFSIQVVNGAMLAVETRLPCVTDFRSADIALGGQGAPLAPAFHANCFRTNDMDRVILNLGGLANITLLPANPEQPITGFDTGPANALMDLWISRATGAELDQGGAFAARGRCIAPLRDAMLDDPYFRKAPPKSTGREYFSLDWLEFHLKTARGAPPEDIQATLLEVSSASIAEAIQAHCPEVAAVFACGGGAKNTRFMERLGALLAPTPVSTTADLGVAPDWVEAAAFAWLARQRVLELPGNLPSVTGARRSAVLGALYHP